MNLADLPIAMEMAQTIMRGAVTNFRSDGFLQQAAFLFGTRVDPNTRQQLSKPSFRVVAMPPQATQQDKDEAIAALGRLARESQAAGVGFLAEAWTASVPVAEAHRIVPGQVDRMAGSREIAYFLLQHRELPPPHRSKIWVADIIRPAVGKPRLGQFLLTPQAVEMFGRLVHLLGSE